MTKDELLKTKTFDDLFNIKDMTRRAEKLIELKDLSKELKCSKNFNILYKSYCDKKSGMGSENIATFIGCDDLDLKTGKWIANGDGVHKTTYRQDGSVDKTVACPHPIYPSKRYMNIDDNTEKLEIRFFKDGKWREVIVEKIIAFSRNKIIDLANFGIDVTSETSKDLVEYLFDVCNLNDVPIKDSIGRMGWIGDKFMPYSDIAFDSGNENKDIFECLHTKGDYRVWFDHVTECRKNKHLRLMMAASLASVLLGRVNGLPFAFHLWGLTGSGKTVALMVAMSIWGDPAKGKLTKSMDMTVNALTSTASFLYSLPFGGDELQTIKNRWSNYDSFIMKATSGIERGRMHYSKLNPTRNWNCAFLFTGEETITKTESGGGVKNRVIEVMANVPIFADGNRTVSIIEDNYGFAGEMFINAIAKYEIKDEYRRIFKGICEKCNTTDKQAGVMALILLADKIACDHIFKNESCLKLKDVDEYLFDISEVDIADRAYNIIVDWIAMSENNFVFTSGDSLVGRTQCNGQCWGRIDAQNDDVLINKGVLYEFLSSKEIDAKYVISKLSENDLVIKNSQGRNVHNTTVNKIKSSYIKLKLPSEKKAFEEAVEDEDTQNEIEFMGDANGR